jgi:hypothetical protein
MGKLATVLRIGYQMCRMNMEHLTRRTNIESTDTATLKSVNLVWVLALASISFFKAHGKGFEDIRL